MNKQIAEKLGCVSDVIAYSDNGESVWKLPDGRIVRKADFTHSLDACVEYIVPWLNEHGYGLKLITNTSGHYAGIANGSEVVSESVDEEETLPLALCKAFMEV